MAILAREKLSERLRSADTEQEIFLAGSWSPDRVRGAAYDLRVAPDYLILPDGRRFWPEAPDPIDRAYFSTFELKPGEVAFVSSTERLCMPWDLAGNIAPKFRLALDGLLVMGGLLVDPGYGRLQEEEDGTWVPRKQGERLHFQLANVGSGNFKIVPNETSVAAIQFLDLVGDPRRQAPGGEMSLSEIDIPTSDRLLRDLFQPHVSEPLPQLQFFPRTTELQGQVAELGSRIETNRIELAAADRSIDRIIVAGFYLVLITIFGVAFAALINSLAD